MCLSALLAACVPLHPATHSGSTVLLDVRLNGAPARDRPLIGLLVSLDAERGAAGRQFAFEPKARVAADYTDFPVRLHLPPGRYRLGRVSGVTRGGVIVPQFDVEPAMVFEVRAAATTDLGRMEIGNEPQIADTAARDGAVKVPTGRLAPDEAADEAGAPLTGPAREQLDGYVDLRFTVASTGEAKDIAIADSQPPGVFDGAALAALAGGRFRLQQAAIAAPGRRFKLHMRFHLQAE